MIVGTETDLDPEAIEDVVRKVFRRDVCRTERVREAGVSTYVYRIQRRTETYYLRVLPATGQSFDPEVRIHALLHERGVRVPRVVYYAPYEERLQRSVMVTTAIEGQSIVAGDTRRISAVLRAAGRDLAVINTIPVEGFGWIRRDREDRTTLQGKFASYTSFLLDGLTENLASLAGSGFSREDIELVRQIVATHHGWLDVRHGVLAHGDFLSQHIYHRDGRYTGIIDFSAVRGAGMLYDLARALTFESAVQYPSFVKHLISGFRDIEPLPYDCMERLTFLSLLIAIGPLSRHVSDGKNIRDHEAFRRVKSGIAILRDRTGAHSLDI